MDRKFEVKLVLDTAEVREQISKLPPSSVQAILDKMDDPEAECPFEFLPKNILSAIGCDRTNTITVHMRLR